MPLQRLITMFLTLFTLSLIATPPVTDSVTNPLTGFTSNKSLSFSGLGYFGYTYDRDDIKEQHENGFNMGRIYLMLRGDINQDLSFNVTTDIETGSGSADLYLKYGFLKYRFSKKVALSFGFIPATMNWRYIFWRYGYLASMADHEMGLATTAYIGANVEFKLNQMVTIHTGVTNGEGYRTVSDPNENKDLYLTVIAKMKMLQMAAHIQYELPLQDNEFYQYSEEEPANKEHSGNKFDLFGHLFAGLDFKVVKTSAAFLIRQNQENMSGAEKITGIGFGGYLEVRLGKLGIHGKVVHFDPDRDKDDDEKLSILAGFDFTPFQNLTVATSWITRKEGEGTPDHQFQLATRFVF